MSWIWHKTIWWWDSCNAGALGNVEYPFIAIAPRFWLGVVVRDKVLFMGQIELFDFEMMYFDIKTVWKQMTYAKLNYFK